MILGIGLDVAQISRFEAKISDEAFLARYFTAKERAYLLSRGVSAAQSLAGMFAAKEALLKAMGTGLRGMRLIDIEITHAESGAPGLTLHGTAKLHGADMKMTRSFLSISHDGGIAAAMVVLEGDG